MDWSNPLVIVGIVQALVYAGTIGVLIWQIRVQTRALRDAEYAKCSSDYSALIRMMIEQPALQSIYDDLAKIEPLDAKWLNYNPGQKLLFNYIELNFELFERVYYLRKWIDDETWSCWEKWLQYLSRHPIFDDVRCGNMGMFGQDFERYVKDLIEKRKSST